MNVKVINNQVKMEPFKGKDGLWYWRIEHQNGHILATGHEGFTERNDAVESYDRLATYIRESK